MPRCLHLKWYDEKRWRPVAAVDGLNEFLVLRNAREFHDWEVKNKGAPPAEFRIGDCLPEVLRKLHPYRMEQIPSVVSS